VTKAKAKVKRSYGDGRRPMTEWTEAESCNFLTDKLDNRKLLTEKIMGALNFNFAFKLLKMRIFCCPNFIYFNKNFASRKNFATPRNC